MADLDITKDDDINQEDLITLDELIRKHGIEKLIKKVTKKVNDQEDISRLLTERELYKLIPPIPKLRRIKSFITTESASRKVPNEPVRLWDDFLSEAFTLSSTLDAKNRIFKRPDFLMLGSFLSVEDSVVDMFLELMKLINNQRLILLPRPERWAKLHLFENVKGQPDAIRCSADNKQLLDEGEASQIQAIVEIKPDQLMKKLLDNKLDLVEAYNRAVNIDDDGTAEFTKHQKIKRIVRQTFGYMVVNDLRYGLLTTYIRTWFFYRDFDDPNILYISPAVAIDQERTSTQISFLECMYYHETISMIDETAHSSPPTDSDKGSDDYDDSSDDDDGDNGGNDEKNDSSYEPRSSSKRKWEDLKVTTRSIAKKKREKRDGNEREKLENMKNYERSQFSFGNMLGNGRFGAVFATKLCGNVGALKMADLYKNEYLLQEILNEIKIYLGPLMDIQCVYIPKLLKFGILHEAFCFILTSLSGKSFAELDDVTEREKQLAIDGLQAIHKRGVIHGDVRLENIVVERSESMSKSRVRWIDFGWSEMGRNSGFDRELFELKSLLV